MSDAPWLRGLHTDTGYLLYRLGLRSGSLFNAGLELHGLRLRHYSVLRYLATVEGARQRELAERLGYDPSAIVSLLDDLERLRLAERKPDPNDRRNRIVVLTEAGRALLRDTVHDAARVTDRLLASLSAEERDTLHALLLRIAEPGADEG
ncbi:MarR family winged helix-turn-helix transcriptional regulator [Streptomyces coffeae]|uniref:Winged helix-turn-helix transcriptional regulator n=1 Tax=Streptomyces coffeae TaxID=621382 RepID=A0ABS1NGU0_9ACTN|nr:MarR family winged helix-turn-helix transcriptional regulator [Streptomyces coffeae]MBL1099219.1 winged helix-turn-helix transcriptional regulator [Streptomyces coffeae]